MKAEILNNTLRTMFKEFITKGFKKRHVCGLILGAQSEPQFEGFLQGRDFGLKPLQRIIDGLGYDLKLVIVEKNNPELSKYLEEVNQENLNTCSAKLENRLNDDDAVKSATTVKTGVIADVSIQLFDEIMK